MSFFVVVLMMSTTSVMSSSTPSRTDSLLRSLNCMSSGVIYNFFGSLDKSFYIYNKSGQLMTCQRDDSCLWEWNVYHAVPFTFEHNNRLKRADTPYFFHRDRVLSHNNSKWTLVSSIYNGGTMFFRFASYIFSSDGNTYHIAFTEKSNSC